MNDPAVPFDEALGDREPQARTAVLACAGRVDLVKRVEHFASFSGRDTDAGVDDSHLDASARGRQERQPLLIGVDDGRAHDPGAQKNGAAGRRELDRVLDEIQKHLTQALGVAAHEWKAWSDIELERDALFAGGRS